MGNLLYGTFVIFPPSETPLKLQRNIRSVKSENRSPQLLHILTARSNWILRNAKSLDVTKYFAEFKF